MECFGTECCLIDFENCPYKEECVEQCQDYDDDEQEER